jgi:hypothetical protein
MRNPPKAEYCIECGTALAQKKIITTRICPTCRIPLESSYYFCHNCGQSVGTLNESSSSKTFGEQVDKIQCPSCGRETTGEYCHECGFHVKSRQSPLDWWYCTRESAIMQEISFENQFLISKKTLEETVASFHKDGRFPSHQREMIMELSKLVFSHDPTRNFCSITEVKCPVCGQTSYASINVKPQTAQSRDTGIKKLTGGNLIRSGIFYLKNFKEFYVIIFFGILVDLIFTFLGFGNLAALDAISAFLVDYDINMLDQNIYAINIGAILLDFILTCFLLGWTLTSFRQIKSENRTSIDLVSSTGSALKSILIVLILQLIPLGVSLLGILGMGLFDVTYYDPVYGMPSTSSIISMLFFSIFFVLAISIVEFGLTIITTYFLPAYFFNSDRSITNSVQRGYRFARNNFWITLGMTVFFNVLSNISSYFAIPTFFIGTSILPILITSFFVRSVAVFRIISFSWAYDEFKDEDKK